MTVMRLPVTFVIVAALLAGCGTEEAVHQSTASSIALPAPITPATGGWEATMAARSQDPDKTAAGPHAPNPERDLDDLVAGCPGMNPQQRPRGSNCFGVFPEQCGADIAAQHLGERMSALLATRLEDIAPGGARIIRPKQAVHDDLRYARLNVILDQQDRISEVDCY
jgi:hypothetical protein